MAGAVDDSTINIVVVYYYYLLILTHDCGTSRGATSVMEQKKVDGTQRLDVHRFPTNTRNQVQSEHPANITQAKVHGEVHCSNGNETDGTGFRASCKRTRLSTVGDQAFPVAAARVWNSLPRHVTSAPSLSVYCSRLKSHLFKQSFP